MGDRSSKDDQGGFPADFLRETEALAHLISLSPGRWHKRLAPERETVGDLARHLIDRAIRMTALIISQRNPGCIEIFDAAPPGSRELFPAMTLGATATALVEVTAGLSQLIATETGYAPEAMGALETVLYEHLLEHKKEIEEMLACSN